MFAASRSTQLEKRRALSLPICAQLNTLQFRNLLVHEGRLVVIDLPQVVDVVGNPQGPAYLVRDVTRIADWFAARGLSSAVRGADTLLDELCRELNIPRESPLGTTSHP